MIMKPTQMWLLTKKLTFLLQVIPRKLHVNYFKMYPISKKSESLKSNNLIGGKDKGTEVSVEKQKPKEINNRQDRRVVESGKSPGLLVNETVIMTPNNPRRNNLIKSPSDTTLYKPAIADKNATNCLINNKSVIERIRNFVE